MEKKTSEMSEEEEGGRRTSMRERRCTWGVPQTERQQGAKRACLFWYGRSNLPPDISLIAGQDNPVQRRKTLIIRIFEVINIMTFEQFMGRSSEKASRHRVIPRRHQWVKFNSARAPVEFLLSANILRESKQ
jgi:hypothetical protein